MDQVYSKIVCWMLFFPPPFTATRVLCFFVLQFREINVSVKIFIQKGMLPLCFTCRDAHFPKLHSSAAPDVHQMCTFDVFISFFYSDERVDVSLSDCA